MTMLNHKASLRIMSIWGHQRLYPFGRLWGDISCMHGSQFGQQVNLKDMQAVKNHSKKDTHSLKNRSLCELQNAKYKHKTMTKMKDSPYMTVLLTERFVW